MDWEFKVWISQVINISPLLFTSFADILIDILQNQTYDKGSCQKKCQSL